MQLTLLLLPGRCLLAGRVSSMLAPPSSYSLSVKHIQTYNCCGLGPLPCSFRVSNIRLSPIETCPLHVHTVGCEWNCHGTDRLRAKFCDKRNMFKRVQVGSERLKTIENRDHSDSITSEISFQDIPSQSLNQLSISLQRGCRNACQPRLKGHHRG